MILERRDVTHIQIGVQMQLRARRAQLRCVREEMEAAGKCMVGMNVC